MVWNYPDDDLPGLIANDYSICDNNAMPEPMIEPFVENLSHCQYPTLLHDDLPQKGKNESLNNPMSDILFSQNTFEKSYYQDSTRISEREG